MWCRWKTLWRRWGILFAILSVLPFLQVGCLYHIREERSIYPRYWNERLPWRDREGFWLSIAARSTTVTWDLKAFGHRLVINLPWEPFFVAAILPATIFVPPGLRQAERRRKLKRLRANRRLIGSFSYCQCCGYDLRASPVRCPECGTAVRRRDG